jgi:hypothetical protein
MKIAKNIFTGLGTIILLLVLISFFLPASYHIERSIEIEQEAEVVYNQVIDFNQYLTWNPWTEKDPDSKNVITGEAGTPGTTWNWDGKITGKGSLTLVDFKKNDFIRNKLVFEYPNQMESEDLWLFEYQKGRTLVRWVNTGDLNFPIGRWFGLFLDNMLGKDFEKGLSNLKIKCEDLP